MSLTGKFEWYQSQRLGGKKCITFILSNTNLLMKENFNIVLLGSQSGQPNASFNNIDIPANKSIKIDYDTVDWDWCQGDKIILTDKNGNAIKQWTLMLPTVNQGSCPQCHGTHKCRNCNGSGVVRDKRYGGYDKCPVCLGSGECQTCYIPIRSTAVQTGNQNNVSQQTAQRQISILRQRLNELQYNVHKLDNEILMWQWKDMDMSLKIAYQSKLDEKRNYARQIAELESKIASLEQILYQ